MRMLVSNTPHTIKGFMRWLGVDMDILLYLVRIDEKRTQPDRRVIGNPSRMPIHMKVEGPPKLWIFVWLLLRESLVM